MPVDDSSRLASRAENVVRKRPSKWDLVSESSVRDETEKDKPNAEATGNAHLNRESKSDWQTPATVSAPSSGWGEWITEDTRPSPGLDAPWSGDQSYATRMSPGLDTWRHRQGSHSPRNDWASTRRSRSRTPPRSFRHDIDDRKERGRKEVHGSIPVCIGYSKGHCRRGSECKYIHQNSDRDIGNHFNKNIATERNDHRQERGRYTEHVDNGINSCSRDRHPRSRFPQDDNIRKRDTERERQPNFCRDFRAGRCFRESGCKYIHDDGVRSSDGFSLKDMVLERKHSGSKEGQEVQGHLQDPKHETEMRDEREPPCRFFARGSCQKGSSCRYSHQVSTHETSGKRSRDEGRSRRVDDHHGSRGSYSEWGTKSAYDGQMSDWGQNSGSEGVGDVKGNVKLLDASCSDKEANTETSNHHKTQEQEPHREDDSKWDPKEDVKYQILPKEGLEACLLVNNQHKNGDPYGWKETAPSEVGLLHLDASATSFRQQHANATLVSTSGSETQSSSSSMWNQVAISASNAPVSAFGWPGPGMNQPVHSQAPIAASIHVLLAQAEAGKKLDTPKADSGGVPVLVNSKMPAPPQLTPSMINSQNSVADDRAVQISNISASLAQIFEKVQQIPQLYNSLNPVGSAALAPSQPFTSPNVIVSTAVTPSVHDQGQLCQSKPYDPITDSMEPLQQSENDKQKMLEGNALDLDKQQASKKLDDLSSIHESNHKEHNSASEQKQGVEGKETCKDTLDHEKEKQTDNSADAHGDTTNEGKKSKETNKEVKGMRMFKFALVEVVKEMLKPTWKEGRMSKEAHKTIVKKVVDKVTSTLQGPQIPNTQERIDQYLAFSKPKLTKLVQAYVEKYLKV
ncbi:unnamed protein product [Victoria cruziana]